MGARKGGKLMSQGEEAGVAYAAGYGWL